MYKRLTIRIGVKPLCSHRYLATLYYVIVLVYIVLDHIKLRITVLQDVIERTIPKYE